MAVKIKHYIVLPSSTRLGYNSINLSIDFYGVTYSSVFYEPSHLRPELVKQNAVCQLVAIIRKEILLALQEHLNED